MPTLAECAQTWLTRLRGGVAELTWKNYRSVVRCHLARTALGRREVATVRPQDIRDFLLDHRRSGKSPGFVRLIQTVTSLALADAAERGCMVANPATRVWRRVPPELRVRDDPDRYTPPPGVASRITMRVGQERPRIAWVVATYQATGCRRNEALGLQADDLDFAGHTITIRRQWYGVGRIGEPKGRRPRTIDMAESLEPVLRAALDESDRIASALGCQSPRWVFRAPHTGAPWHPVFVGRVMGAASADVCGERFGPKAFRHAVATKLLYEGESPRYVQELLGHGHLSTTMKYVAHRGTRNRRAINRTSNL